MVESRKEKKRLDNLLIERGLVLSRQWARGYILAGNVLVDGQMVDQVSKQVGLDSTIEIKGKAICPYVSRGGWKLERALEAFSRSVREKVALDVGASTGGFTDCLLQKGCRRVYAVDVGYGQLAWTLRRDSRVIPLERRNIRYLTPTDFPEKTDLATIDVSFISLSLILSVVKDLIVPGGDLLCLVKPQFEVGKGEVGKGGVVRDTQKHEQVLRKIIAHSSELGLGAQGLIRSPLKGPKGNVEFFLHFRSGRQGPSEEETSRWIAEVVE